MWSTKAITFTSIINWGEKIFRQSFLQRKNIKVRKKDRPQSKEKYENESELSTGPDSGWGFHLCAQNEYSIQNNQ